MKICQVGAELYHAGRQKRRGTCKAKCRSLQFANVPNKWLLVTLKSASNVSRGCDFSLIKAARKLMSICSEILRQSWHSMSQSPCYVYHKKGNNIKGKFKLFNLILLLLYAD
jgi:hypothetical protein